MVAHPRLARVEKRQTASIPTAAGIDGTAVVGTAVATDSTSLAFDGTVSVVSTQTAPPLVPGGSTPTVTTTASTTATPTTSSATSSSTIEPAAAASKTIALSTVVGTCVGAFIGASALIVFGLWVYRRYSRSLKQRTRGPLVHPRNKAADQQRRQSKREPWKQLEDDDGSDKWEKVYQTKETREVDQVAPMEKLTMFKKTASIRTAYTHTDMTFDYPQSYGEFDPKLAETLTTGAAPVPEPRPFMGREGATGAPQSWDSDNMTTKSFLTVHTQMTSGAMSPTLHMAIPTPTPTATQTHIWESAEVEHAEQQVDDNRRSTHNPFFSARDVDPRPRSRSNSVTKSPKAKGKERMRYSEDPFDDINEPMPPPKFIHHLATSSSSSTDSKESKEKALQSLIAALDISEDEARSRLRIASMQPSFISGISGISSGSPDEEDVTKEFPLPPSQSGGSSQFP